MGGAVNAGSQSVWLWLRCPDTPARRRERDVTCQDVNPMITANNPARQQLPHAALARLSRYPPPAEPPTGGLCRAQYLRASPTDRRTADSRQTVRVPTPGLELPWMSCAPKPNNPPLDVRASLRIFAETREKSTS